MKNSLAMCLSFVVLLWPEDMIPALLGRGFDVTSSLGSLNINPSLSNPIVRLRTPLASLFYFVLFLDIFMVIYI